LTNFEPLRKKGVESTEGIAREAFAWAAAEFAQQDLPDIESQDAGQWIEFLALR